MAAAAGRGRRIPLERLRQSVGGPTKQQQVEEELPRLLEKGPVSNQEIIQHFKNKGIQDRTVNLVKGRLNIRSVRKGDKWYWQLNA